MEEKEYAVVIKNADDFDEIHQLITSTYGDEYIPPRNISVANYREFSDRITHYFLTESEANVLKNHPKISSVEIPPQLNDKVLFRKNYSVTSSFDFTANISSNELNWGLARCTNTDNPWITYSPNTSITSNYNYMLTGKNVDIVILDSGITPNNPEWEDSSGTSRLQQIDWYAASGVSGTLSQNHYLDYNGHGSHVAGIVAGKTQGWAKNSRIYSIKCSELAGSEGGGIPIANIFDIIRLWHINKPIDPTIRCKRPTVVNIAFTTLITDLNTDIPNEIFYQGSKLFKNSNYSTLDDIKTNYLWNGTLINGFYYTVYSSPTLNAEVEDLTKVGIHVVTASDNLDMVVDLPGGNFYNNTWGGYLDSYYCRGGFPTSPNAIVVGGLYFDEINISDEKEDYSSYGAGVDVYAPGANVISVSSKDNSGTNETVTNLSLTTVTQPADSNYNFVKLSGTSVAASQVSGVLACLLEMNPNMSPSEAKKIITTNAITGQMIDYSYQFQIHFGNDGILYNPFNVDKENTISDGLELLNGVINLS